MLSDEWETEIQRRLADLDAGRGELVTWDEVRRRAFAEMAVAEAAPED